MPRLISRLILILLLTLAQTTAWSEELYHLDGDFESMLARAASLLDGEPLKTVHVSTYKMKLDSAGMALLAGLVHAAQQGADTRLLVDNKILDATPGIIAYAQEQGVKIRFYRTGKIGIKDVLNPLETFHRLNSRLHSKLFIVNEKEAYVGDKNYTMKSFRTMLGLSKKTITMLGKEILVTGAPVRPMSEYYDALWNHPDSIDATDKTPTAEQRIKYQKVFDEHLSWLKEQLKKRGSTWKTQNFEFEEFKWLSNTKEKTTMAQVLEILSKTPAGTPVLIESPYFILYPELTKIVKKLREQNSPVTILMNSPDVADLPLIGEALKIDLPKLLEMGLDVELIDFRRRITHGKVVLIGDKDVIIGSGNFDPRSFSINEESNLFVRSQKFSAHLWKQFENSKHLRSRAYLSESATISCEKSIGRRIYLPVPISKTKKLFIEAIRPQL